MKIAEVIQGGPVDLAASTIKAGHVIEAIDGNGDRRLDGFLQAAQSQGGKYTLLSVYDPAANKRWDETVKPVEGVKKASCYTNAGSSSSGGGREAFRRQDRLVHVRAMNDASMRTVFEEALGLNIRKDAISSTRVSTAAETSTNSSPIF